MSNTKGSTSEVYIDKEFVIKKQTKFLPFNLILNEFEKLRYLRLSPHTPLALFMEADRVLRLENVGKNVTKKNLPTSWEHQIEEIRRTLNAAGIIHRDIRPDNFLVKDGWLYLIGFSWAVFNSQGKFGPLEIGEPFKSPDGWDDNFSFDLVVKHFKKLKRS